MNCADLRILLPAYADGELDLVRSLEVEQHLQTCAACTARNRAIRSLRVALHAVPLTYAAPPAFRREVQKLVQAPEREAIPRSPRRLWLRQWFTTGVAAAAMLLLLLRPAGHSPDELLASELVAGHVRSLMPGHLTDVLSSDQHTVKPWFNGKLDFSPTVKDFAAEGFPLVGGRLDYLDGRAVSALVYRHNLHIINVFVWPSERNQPGESLVQSRRGYNLISRAAGGWHYGLVSDLNPAELKKLADLVTK